MNFPSDLHTLVDKLAVAMSRQKYLNEQLEKLQAVELEIRTLRAQLTQIVDRAGFPEEAVDLLLAAR